MPDQDNAIGIFDSGVGGLTVLNRIAARMPNESLIYLGDTARVPYGTKSAATVERYARACTNMLLKDDVKLIVVACNTASAYALETLQDELPVPVLGVIEPGARRAVEQTRNGRVGVIGTAGTIGSSAYQNVIGALAPEVQVWARPCPLFVPLAEEGWIDGDVPSRVAEAYLRDMLDEQIDTLLLGCTHYPLLKQAIASVSGPAVRLVDSAEATADVVADILDAMELHRRARKAPLRRFLVTDSPDIFTRLGKQFLGQGIGEVEWVDFT